MKDNLSSLMITYPNTYGIFDENIKEIINIIHENGGLVYMDGANMNAHVLHLQVNVVRMCVILIYIRHFVFQEEVLVWVQFW